MSQIKMVALRRHPFGVGTREKGEEYEANANEARILTVLGWAREAASVKAVPQPEAPKVEKVISPETQPAAQKATKQTYRTRDMKAKD